MVYKLVAFDLDGTLVRGSSSWWKLHRRFGTYDESLKNLNDYENEVISYAEFVRRDVALWGRVHVEKIKRVLLDYELNPGAEYVVRQLKERGYKIAIVTCGLDFLANDVAGRLGVETVLANGVTVDDDGYLTGGDVFRVDLFRKDRALARLASKLGVSLKECVAVGDSKYDRNFLKNSGFGIAINPDVELVEVADVVVENLKEILEHL